VSSYYSLAIHFALIITFGSSMPSALSILLLYQALSVYLTKYSLSHLYRRSLPKLSISIGNWSLLMHVVSLLSIPLNAISLTHSLHYLGDTSDDLRLLKSYNKHFFGIFSTLMFLLKLIINIYYNR
jgi:hypothetical protein